MIFSYNWLQEYIKDKLPRPKRLAELLTMHSFEVEEIKKKGKDWILDIDVLSNRAPDCFSHIGIARECCALTGSKLSIPSFRIREDKNSKASDFVKVKVEDTKACSRYTARVIFDLKVDSSPVWLKERLKACGLRTINNVVDIANFVMLETGQPLHAFDSEKLEGKKIIVRFAKKGEKIVTLDDEKYKLDQDVLVIADEKKPIGIAGVKGGKGPEVDKETKVIVLESANFNPRMIRRGSRKLGLRTDASVRFEHGIDPNLTQKAIDRAAFLIQQIACPPKPAASGAGRRAGGKIAKGLIDIYPKKVLPTMVRLDIDYVERLLGVKVPPREIIRILKSLGLETKEQTKGSLTVQVPTFRQDISLPEDLIEEIGRIYGYEKIESIFPTVALIPPKRNINIFWESVVKDILKGAGFTEVYNYSFINPDQVEIFGFKKNGLIEVENPISVEQQYLRVSLIPNLLKNVKENFKNFDEIRIFELGKIFLARSRANPLELEKRMLTGVIATKNPSKDKLFYQAKGSVSLLLEKLAIANVWYDSFQPTWDFEGGREGGRRGRGPEEGKISIWHAEERAEIKTDSQEIGFLGEVHKEILKNLKIKGAVVLFDLDFEKLQKLASEEHEYQPISSYPAAIRDLAILVPRQVLVEDVLNEINTTGGALVRDVDLFDIYEGEELPEGKKNLAFHIIYQAEDRTLKSKEIDQLHQKIVKALEKNPEWEVRR